jgi:phosphoglycerate dehydrogenase-like enzyme
VEADMIQALLDVPTRAAVLDVTFPEPPEADSPLYTVPNVFLTPHIAGSLGNEVHRMAEYMYEEYKAFDAGQPTRYGVTIPMLATMA